MKDSVSPAPLAADQPEARGVSFDFTAAVRLAEAGKCVLREAWPWGPRGLVAFGDATKGQTRRLALWLRTGEYLPWTEATVDDYLATDWIEAPADVEKPRRPLISAPVKPPAPAVKRRR